MLEKDIKKVLFSQEDIVAKTKELGQQLTEDYAGKNPLLVCVLKGAVPFMAELINISTPILRWTLWSFLVMVAELSAAVK